MEEGCIAQECSIVRPSEVISGTEELQKIRISGDSGMNLCLEPRLFTLLEADTAPAKF